MRFDSLEFLIFLPLVTVLHWCCPQRCRWAVLLGASLLFYGWWDPRLTLLILGVTAVSYLAALGMANAPLRRMWLGLTVAVCLGVLGFFKYFNFFGQAAAALAGRNWTAWNIVLPVGISFYTFQAMSYVIDVYRGELEAERHFGYFALYISFFPQLVAGPIERAGSLLPQLRGNRRFSARDLSAGCRLLLGGFFRKIVVADLCAPFVEAVYSAARPDGSAVFLGTVLFALQIYCDFSGYSLIAAGAARLLGIRLMKNFDGPYSALTVRDFWRRWHISLTKWFTDYVYIPLGGSRRGKGRQIAATMTVFALSGLWHGADWTFVLWGILHGVYLTVEILLDPGKPQTAAGGMLRRCVTLGAVLFAWIFFRAESLAGAMTMLSGLFSPWDLSGGMACLGITLKSALTVGFAAATLGSVDRFTREEPETGSCTWVLILGAVAAGWLLRLESGADNAFIYFRF